MKIAHIGIAVSSLPEAMQKYGALLANNQPHREQVAEQRVDVASYPVGEARIELTAATDETSPIARFIEKRGEGIHHVAIEVEDIHAELARLRESGVRLIDETPRLGAHGMLIAFIHPSAFNGVLLELCQYAPSHA